jgi:uncharacterized membrane protein
MTRTHSSLLAMSCIVSIITAAISDIAGFQIVRIVLGLLIVLLLPGFALVSAVVAERQFSASEYLLASVGASLAISTVAAVALGAAPIGLTRLSFSIVLGGCTLILSAIVVLRARFSDQRRKDENRQNGVGS